MEKNIISLFIKEIQLKFNEIEKLLKIRSNKLDYHLKKLVKKGVLNKENGFYSLSESSEYLIPYLSNKESVLPVILICIGNSEKAFFYKREKRPYKGFLSLPGGRLRLGEEINGGVKRIMKEKHKVNAEYEKINSVSLEHVKKNGKIIHSFLLIFVSAKIKQEVKLTKVSRSKSKIIPSDYKLIKEDLNKEVGIKSIFSKG